MTPSSRRSRHIVEQRLPPRFAKRSSATPSPSFGSTVPPSGTPPSTSSTPGPPGVTLPPHGVLALIGIVVMLSLAILGFTAWRVWVYRRDKKAARTVLSEKSSKPVSLYASVDDDSKSKRTLSIGDPDPIAFPPKAGNKPLTRERTAAEIAINLGYCPKVVYAASGEKATPPPPGIKVTPPSGLQITPPPVYVSVPPPVLSPRTAASIAPTGKTAPRAKYHRLVVVESTYTPTLCDELEIREGETLQLLEEYEDEWCLVQRVGQKVTKRGVVPRFCVVEKRKSNM